MVLFACSGSGAAAVIARNIDLGYDHALLAGGLLAASLVVALVSRQWWACVALGVLLVIHPAWTISAVTGDCGEFKRSAAITFSLIGASLLALQCGAGLCSRLVHPRRVQVDG